MAFIHLQDVDLTFIVQKQTRSSLKDYFLDRLYRRQDRTHMAVKALNQINLRVDNGERLGILGHNGAGKSTMLKMLAGVYQPTAGTRNVEGKISSLFDLVLGFEMESSGWDNIAYRGYLQGESPRTIRAKQQSIAEFSELGEFLNMPVRYYSSGMMIRLAFAIATAVDPEILLIDEVLSVGDLAFHKKARARMFEMMDRAHLMVMVSHDLNTLESICNRAIWMDHGSVRMEGPAGEVVQAYRESVPAEAEATAA